MTNEVFVYTQVLGDTFNTVFEKMQEFRELRKTIELRPDMSGDQKRIQINELYALENIMLKEYLDQVAEADIDFILEKTMFGIFEVPTYEPSDDKKKSTFKKSRLLLPLPSLPTRKSICPDQSGAIIGNSLYAASKRGKP